MADPQLVKGILQDGRELVRKSWWDGTFRSDGQHCSLTALGPTFLSDPDRFAAAEALAAAMGCEVEDIPDWNDSHTHAEVIAAYDKAISSFEPAATGAAFLTVAAAGDAVASEFVAEHPTVPYAEAADFIRTELSYAAGDATAALSVGVVWERP